MLAHFGMKENIFFTKTLREDGEIASLWIDMTFKIAVLNAPMENAGKLYFTPDDTERYRKSRLGFNSKEKI